MFVVLPAVLGEFSTIPVQKLSRRMLLQWLR
jgi:hypothetical protein